MAGDEDDAIHEYFRGSAFPKEAWVSAILAALELGDGSSIAELEGALNLRHGQIEHVLKFLSTDNPAPVIKDGSRWRRTPVEYRMDHDRIHRLTEQREVEWREVQAYVDKPGCLMAFLARALDEADPRPCGKCARCLGRPVVEPTFTRAPRHRRRAFSATPKCPWKASSRSRRTRSPSMASVGPCRRHCAPKPAGFCPAGATPAGGA